MDLATPLQYIKGAGPKRAERLAGIGLVTAGDLIEHYPRNYIDRSRLTPLGSLTPGMEATSSGTVRSITLRRTRGRRQNVHALLEDGTGLVECVWFNQPFLRKVIQPDTRLIVSGAVELFGRLQFKNPEFEIIESADVDSKARAENPETPDAPGIVPVYALTAGVPQKVMRHLVKVAVNDGLALVEEFMPAELLKKRGLIAWREAHREIHRPASPEALAAARERIAYQELFDLQLLLAVSRRHHRRPRSAPVMIDADGLYNQMVRSLPFQLTGAQQKAIDRIRADLAKDVPMHRLLEGDVGSGKTLVALAGALIAAEAGYQVALMAPTEILANQHAATFAAHCGALGVRADLLLGGMAARQSREIREALLSGETGIVIGTHALIQTAVEYHQLGLVIVDEQHRFGVMQRARLLSKGKSPHMLIMTATPIPRTLALTLFGDLDLSVLDEKPAGRMATKTHAVGEERYEEMLQFIATELAAGAQSYFVCPLIDASEKSDLKAATDLYHRLSNTTVLAKFPGALLHGRMKSQEKASVMSAFAAGDIKFLVSTTVIEVGVDVGNASLMVIEHPERFGLSQLHQLRGRIGRGRAPSHLFMIRRSGIGDEARERMQIMVRENDGFKIAEADLRHRGPGDFFGVQQSGLPALKVADPIQNPHVLEMAREDAFSLAGQYDLLELAGTPLWGRLKRRFGERMKLYEVG
jgi:ATP-dependent DNA helicase RecG